MKYAILDIGSNSVRLAIFADGNVIYRDKITSRLGEGIISDRRLKDVPKKRTLDAIEVFLKKALDYDVFMENILPFATAAVRQTENGREFVEEVYKTSGVSVSVLSEAEECQVAVLGALNGGDGAVLDVGGASSELVVCKNKKIVFAESLPFGAVRVYDAFKNDNCNIFTMLEKEAFYHNAPKIESLTLIGGTASCLAYCLSGDKVYDRDKNHLRFVPITDLYAYLLKIRDLGADEISALYAIEKTRAETIFYGGALIYTLLKHLGVNGYTISENDNLEGYYLLKVNGNEYEEK